MSKSSTFGNWPYSRWHLLSILELPTPLAFLFPTKNMFFTISCHREFITSFEQFCWVFLMRGQSLFEILWLYRMKALPLGLSLESCLKIYKCTLIARIKMDVSRVRKGKRTDKRVGYSTVFQRKETAMAKVGILILITKSVWTRGRLLSDLSLKVD